MDDRPSPRDGLWTEMEKVTQTNAATAEESAAASEELSAQAQAALDSVRQLEALTGGVQAASAPAPSGPVVPSVHQTGTWRHKRAA